MLYKLNIYTKNIIYICVFFPQPLKTAKYVIPKSRYDSIDSYISPCSAKYNDIELVKHDATYKQLSEAGITSIQFNIYVQK